MPLTLLLLAIALAITGLIGAVVVSLTARGFGAYAAVQAALLGVGTLALVAYVQSDDSYRNNGTSRWDAYDEKGLTMVAVGAGAGAALVLIVAAAGRRRRPGAAGFLVSSAASVLLLVATVANSSN
jgi:hypothetical protein